MILNTDGMRPLEFSNSLHYSPKSWGGLFMALSKKTVMSWSVILIVVFGVTVVLYPMIFNSVNDTAPAATPEPVSVPEK